MFRICQHNNQPVYVERRRTAGLVKNKKLPGVDVRSAARHPVRNRAHPNDGDQAREYTRRWSVCLRSRGTHRRMPVDAPRFRGRTRVREAHRFGYFGSRAQGVRGTLLAEVFRGTCVVHSWAIQVTSDVTLAILVGISCTALKYFQRHKIESYGHMDQKSELSVGLFKYSITCYRKAKGCSHRCAVCLYSNRLVCIWSDLWVKYCTNSFLGML